MRFPVYRSYSQTGNARRVIKNRIQNDQIRYHCERQRCSDVIGTCLTYVISSIQVSNPQRTREQTTGDGFGCNRGIHIRADDVYVDYVDVPVNDTTFVAGSYAALVNSTAVPSSTIVLSTAYEPVPTRQI